MCRRILAHAYLIYKDIDPDFAQECLDAAINAWKFLEKNPENIVSPPGPYNVYDDSGDRLWLQLRCTELPVKRFIIHTLNKTTNLLHKSSKARLHMLIHG